MTPEQLTALAPFIGITVFLVVAIFSFRNGFKNAQERKKRLEEEKKDDKSTHS